MRNKLLWLLLVGALILLTFEVVARLTTPSTGWTNPRYLEMSEGFPELEALIEDNLKAFSGVKYYDEFLYGTAPVSTPNVTFTDYFSARQTPDSAPLPEAEVIVWAFGGSTMENHETTDSLTIANTWARELNRALGPTHVKNFGSGGFFSSYELVKFQRLLREVPAAELPSVAIFYDGYNDALFGFQYGPGQMQGDLSLKLGALVEQNHLALGAYAISSLLERYSRLWERTGARLVEARLFPLPEPQASSENLAGAVRIYVSNVRMTKAICRAFQVRCFFVLQPLLVTKDPLTALEQDALDFLEGHPRFGREGSRFVRAFYQAVRGELEGDASFVDASRILDGRGLSDLYDLGHVSARTPPVIGRLTAELILARMAAESGS